MKNYYPSQCVSSRVTSHHSSLLARIAALLVMHDHLTPSEWLVDFFSFLLLAWWWKLAPSTSGS
jgi:hypothetical protein